MSFNSGLYTLIKNNFTEFQGVDSQGNSFYKVFNIQTFNTLNPPYCSFCRHSRTTEKDLDNNVVAWTDNMSVKIYHNDSLSLETLQLKMRTFLESLWKTTVGSNYVQKIFIEDDYQQVFTDADKGLLLYEGILELEVVYKP